MPVWREEEGGEGSAAGTGGSFVGVVDLGGGALVRGGEPRRDLSVEDRPRAPRLGGGAGKGCGGYHLKDVVEDRRERIDRRDRIDRK